MLFALLPLALAHKPSFGTHSTAADAFVTEDPEVSIVLYQEITCEDDALWLTFEGEAGFDLYLQAGVPQIDRLEEYQPSIAFIAKGLPEPDEALPFEIPDGYGVELYSPEPQYTEFYEPFTQTDSWVWVEDWTVVPEDGTAYVVAWNDDGWTGKLWLAIGTVEKFDDVAVSEFIEWNEQVNDFHETGAYEIPIPIEEQECVDASLEGDEAPKQGCTVAPAAPGAGVIALLLAGLRRRERTGF